MAESSALQALTADERRVLLGATRLLDSPPEEAFDRITRLAQRLLRVDAVLVSIVDKDRQFFKSARGLPAPWSSARESPLTHSFCQYVVATERPLVTADARTSELLRRSGAIGDMGVVAYAGMPLLVSGEVLGTLCIIETQPHEWTDSELEILGDLTRITGAEIERQLRSRTLARAAAVCNEVARRVEPLAVALRGSPGNAHESGSHALAARRAELDRVATLIEQLHAILRPHNDDVPLDEKTNVGDRTARAAEIAGLVSGSNAIAVDVRDGALAVRCSGYRLERALSALFVACLHSVGPGHAVDVVVARGVGGRALIDVNCPGRPMAVADLARLVARFAPPTCAASNRAGREEATIRSSRGAIRVESGAVYGESSRDGTTVHVEIEVAEPADG